MEIFFLEKDLVNDVAGIHFDSLPNDFLPSLGFEFLNNVFYRFVLNDANSVCLVSIKDNKCIGFLLLTFDSSKFLRLLIRNNFLKIGYYFIKSAIKNPKIIPFAIGLISSVQKNEKEMSNFAEIYEIAVDERARGFGVGDALVKKSIELASRKSSGIKIKTLKANKNWVDYFLKNKWRLSKEYSFYGKTYVIMEKSFMSE